MELTKQDMVALSSTEVEYVVVTIADFQALWLPRMSVDILNQQEGAIKIFYDNKAIIAKTKNPDFHSKTKHIDIR